MSHHKIELPQDAEAAKEELIAKSQDMTVVVFKKSPICPVSFHAEAEYKEWLADRPQGAKPIGVCEIDVLAEKPLARGLVAALGIAHQSPQALVFKAGEVVWHDSHDNLNVKAFTEWVDQ